MSKAGLIGALAALSTTAAPTAIATSTSHAIFWQNSSGKVGCGVEIHARNTPAKQILCSARGIPRPKRSGNVGDPFVQLAATGSPRLVLISQDSFVGNKATKLGAGSIWSRLGVTCKVYVKTVTCSNGAGHGFTIGNGAYHSF